MAKNELNKKHAQFLAGIHQRSGFKDWLEDVENGAPIISSFDPQNPEPKEVWAYRSGMREGYKLALSHLGVKLDE